MTAAQALRVSSQPVTAIIQPLPGGVGLLLAAVLLAAVFGLSLPDDLLWQRVLEDSGHGPVFAALAVVMIWWRSPAGGQPLRSSRQYQRVFMLAVVLGVATELAQDLLPLRNVSARDALHDAAGAALGLVLFWWVERRRARRKQVDVPWNNRTAVLAALALGALTLLAWQPLQCARAYAERWRAWPDLLPLSEPASAAFLEVRSARLGYAPLPARHARPGDGPSLRLDFDAGARPALRLIEPTPDWTGKDALVVDVTNPSTQPVWLVLRVFDRQHDWSHADRFNQPVVIPASTRTSIRIALEAIAESPRTRRMDMREIADVMLFARRPLDAGALYVTRVGLE